MNRLGTAVVALLAVVALAGAAGTFDAVDGPVIEDDGAAATPTMTPPEPGGVSPGGGSGDSGGSRVPTRTTPGLADDSGGFSPLVVPGVVGSLFASALLVVVLTGDDDRVPDAPADADGGDPLPSVDPDYDSPDGAVARAWRTLRDRTGADETATPAEVAARALDRRLPTQAVSVVTDRFCAVRYGDEAPSETGDEVVAATRQLDGVSDEDDGRVEGAEVSDDRT